MNKNIIEWLIDGDPSIKYQTYRDLLNKPGKECAKERKNINQNGWAQKLLSYQGENYLWNNSLYSPKWISTTYTLYTLAFLQAYPVENILKACEILLDKGFSPDKGINYWKTRKNSETCVTGITLFICSFFLLDDKRLPSLVEHLLEHQMDDGGWNCQWEIGATHSSFHTTIIVLEALNAYQKGYMKQDAILEEAQKKGMEFLLQHKMYQSHRTGKTVDKKMVTFPFPPHWHYDIMRGLDYAQARNYTKDPRFEDAIKILYSKRNKDGTWNMNAGYPAKKYFSFEKTGNPSMINTLRGTRILKWWESK